MDKLIIKGGSKISGSVNVHGSKNSALPIIVSSLLSEKTLKLSNVPNVVDVLNLIKLLKNYGVKIEHKKNKLKINPSKIKNLSADYDVVRKMRASILILGPLLSRFGEARISLPGGCAIGTRPIDIHLAGLSKLGANFEIQNGFVVGSVKSQLIGNKIKLPFPSVGATENILMASILAKGETKISNAAREPEIQDLCQMLNKMGAKIYDSGKEKIIIDGVNKLCGCTHKVIPDRIEAGTFLIAAAATSSSITISPVIPNHLEAVTNKLQESGSKITIKGNSITIKGKKIKGVDIETAPFPGFPTDLQAPFTTLMAIANGESKITETIFENRMNHIYLLNEMGASIKLNKNVAHIKGVKTINGMNLVGSDLRSSAALIIAGIIAKGSSNFYGLEHLDRGYENFEIKLKNLGVKIVREISKNTFEENGYKIEPRSENLSKLEAA